MKFYNNIQINTLVIAIKAGTINIIILMILTRERRYGIQYTIIIANKNQFVKEHCMDVYVYGLNFF